LDIISQPKEHHLEKQDPFFISIQLQSMQGF